MPARSKRGQRRGASRPEGTQVRGTIIAAYGRRVQVRLDDGEELNCLMRGRSLRPVCADRVSVTRSDQGNVVTDIEPRDRVLSRPDRRGREEVLAANVERLVIVTAPEPAPDPFITDRYLASAERMNAAACVVFNKADTWADALPDWLAVYEQLDYPVFVTSASAFIRDDLPTPDWPTRMPTPSAHHA
ncbi:MAG: GTPase RsgA, partial [Pseudomonadota bacterium]